MPFQVNAAETIDPTRGMAYRLHHWIDPSIYPQVHDFYELTLVTAGRIRMTVDGRSETLGTGALVLLRPGDVHSRRTEDGSAHINVAFPAAVIDDMFRYLGDPEARERILTAPRPPRASLTDGQRLLLQARLEQLNLLPSDRPFAAGAALRGLILEVLAAYIIPPAAPAPRLCPQWLEQLLARLDCPDSFGWDLAALSRVSGYSREYLCRSFHRYLGVSPIAYLNAKRLGYASELLCHSDRKVTDIAYAAGFHSLSRFYHAFRREYGVPPQRYRLDHGHTDRTQADIENTVYLC